MIQHREKRWWYLLNGACRYSIVRIGVPFNKHLIINEFPKSGGTWLTQMLAEALQLPFPQNRLPHLSSCIMHGHYGKSWKANDMIVLWRDGRDVIISLYYHYLFQNEKGNPRITQIIKNRLNFTDLHDIQHNLPRFIQFVFDDRITPRFSWADHVNAWREQQVSFTRYEDLRTQTTKELHRLIVETGRAPVDKKTLQQIVQKYSFEKQSGRKPGQENPTSFIRKGIVGDWKNHFTSESRHLFGDYAGQQLIDLEYEPSSTWITKSEGY